MKGVYKIKNVTTGEYYIGSSKNLSNRLMAHKVMLRSNKHTNYKLQDSYNKYGEDSFVFYELEILSEVTKDIKDLILLEQKYLDASDNSKLFNIKNIATNSRTKVIEEVCYVLNLENSVYKTFNSVSEVFRWLQSPIEVDNLNMPIIYKNKYRLVTKYFFDTNYDLIKNWKCSNTTTYHVDSKNTYFKTCKIYCNLNQEILEFNDFKIASSFLGISQSNIINILKGNILHNPLNIRVTK